MSIITVLALVAVVALGYALYKHLTVAGIKAEIAKLEASAVTDGKAVIAAIKAKL